MKEKGNFLLYRGLVPKIITDATHDEAIEAAKEEYKKYGKTNDIELHKRTRYGTEPILKWPAGSNMAMGVMQ